MIGSQRCNRVVSCRVYDMSYRKTRSAQHECTVLHVQVTLNTPRHPPWLTLSQGANTNTKVRSSSFRLSTIRYVSAISRHGTGPKTRHDSTARLQRCD